MCVLALVANQAIAAVPPAPKLPADAYFLMDATTGQVLVDHNGDLSLPPASLTKIMTSYVLAEEVDAGRASLDDMIKVSRNAWSQNPTFKGSSLMWIEPGKPVSLADLERGVVISSGNDASVAVAEHLAGTESSFVDVMNQLAAELGLDNTVYRNPHGLPHPEHRTTARDLATLSVALINGHPEHYKIYKEQSFTYNGIKQANRNSLLFRDPTVDGLKTGHTEEAGYCLVASAERDGFRLISVVMGTASEKAREQETTKLMQYGFRYFSGQTVFEAGQPLPESSRKVWFGEAEAVELAPTESLYVTLPLGRESSIQATLDAPETLDAPLEAGAVVGTVKIMLGERVLAESPVAVAQAVPEGGLFKRLMDFVLRLFA